MAEKSRRWSPYNYVENNPIRMIDPDGMETEQVNKPTPKEAQRMAALVNGDKTAKLIGGWGKSNVGSKLGLDKSLTGNISSVFQRTTKGKTEYAYVSAGTDPTNKVDIANNVLQLFGKSPQMTESIQNATAISREVGSSELTMVGYSKGGAEAAADAMATGRDGITFNAAAVSSATISQNHIYAPNGFTVDNYNVSGQILSPVESIIGLSPMGTNHNLSSSSPFSAAAESVSPIISILDSFVKHMMPSVSSALGK